MELCLQCKQSDRFRGIATGVADWILRSGRDNALPPNPPEASVRSASCPTNSTVKIRIKVGGKDRPVLVWAAKSRKIGSPITDAATAYGRYPNRGIGMVRNGILTATLRCPQPYRESGRVWPPHIHYAERRKEKNRWVWDDSKVFAVAAFPTVGGKEYSMECVEPGPQCCFLSPKAARSAHRRGALTLVSALPEGIKRVEAGPRSVQIPYNAPLQDVRAAARRAKIGDSPYVVYCWDEKCDAAEQLVMKMVQCGHSNVYVMPAGVVGWADEFDMDLASFRK